MDTIDKINTEINRLNEWNTAGRFAEVLVDSTALLDAPIADEDEDDDEVRASLFVIQGNALYGLGRFEEALKAYAQAIELDTFDVQARCNYGSTLYTLGRYVDALNACDAAILTDENFAPSYVNVAHCLVALKHEGEAVYALRQAFSLAPEDSELGRTVADMAADLEDYDVALETYLDVAALPDAPADIHQTIHDFFIRFKNHPDIPRTDWTKGVDDWRRKFATNPDVLRLSGELLRG